MSHRSDSTVDDAQLTKLKGLLMELLSELKPWADGLRRHKAENRVDPIVSP
jgi:hypothetical protein